MKSIICKNCSASSLLFKNGFWICDYCGSKHIASKEEQLEVITYHNMYKTVYGLEKR